MAEINFRKRGNKWEWRFEGAKIEGKRNQISKGGYLTKKECTEAGTKALAEYNNAGLHFEPSEISVSDYLDYWMDTYGKMNLKYSTQVGYVNIIENHLKPTFGQYKIKSLNAGIIQDYTNRLKISGYSRSHVTGIITTLSGALNYAIEPLHYIQFNPCDRVKYPKFNENPKEKRFLISVTDFKRMIERFEKQYYYMIALMVGFYTGFRISETFGLTWDNVDFKNSTITIDKQIIKRNFGVDIRQAVLKKGKKEEKSSWYFSSPKTTTSCRTIKCGQTLMSNLRKYRNWQLENSLKYGEYYTEHFIKEEKDEKGNPLFRVIPVSRTIPCSLKKVDMVFIRENGEYISTDSFKYCARIIHHEMNIEFNYHSLRHTHATMLIESGVSVKSVQERLGHSDVKTTLQTYVHNTPAMEDNLVETFEKVVHQ